MNFGVNMYNWLLSNAQPLVLVAIVVIGLYLGFKRLRNFIAVGRCAARAAAHHNMASVHVPLPLPQRAAAPMVNSVTGLPPMMCSATTRLTFSGVIFT